MRIYVIAAAACVALGAFPAAAVPYEARPPHVRQGPMLSDPTFVGAISDARLREIVADIHAGRTEIAKRKLVLFLNAVPGNVQAIEILGTLMQNEGNLDQAVQLLQQGAKMAPQQVSLRIRLAIALMNQQRFDEAAPHLQYAIEQEPDNALALANYAWLLASLGHDRQAVDAYERLRAPEFGKQVNPTDVFVGLSVLYERLGQYDRTIALLAPEFEKISAPHENNRLFLNLADAYLQTGKPADAAKVLDRLDGLVPGKPVGLVLARANVIAASGAPDKAAALLASALKDHPGAAADIHLAAARIEMGRSYYRRAREEFARAADAASGENRTAILAEMTAAFEKAEKPGEITSTLEKFATTGGNSPRVWLLLAENMVQAGRKTDALALIDRQIAAHPDLAQAHFLKAIVLRSQDRVAEARAAMRKSVEIDPRNPTAWHLLADLSHDTNGDAAVLDILKEGLDHNPTDAHLLLGVGSISYSQGEVDYANGIFKRMAARYPEDPIALTNLALTALDLGEPAADVEATIKRAVERAPRVPIVADTWGWMLVKSGKAAEAVNLLQQVAKAAPDDGGVTYHLGLAYEAAGEDGLGKAALRKALALGVPKHYREDIVRRLAGK